LHTVHAQFLPKNVFLRKGCLQYTCNKFFEKLLEYNHSASRHGHATGAVQRPRWLCDIDDDDDNDDDDDDDD